MVIETGLVVGYLISWAVRKARRAAGPLDAIVDDAMDAGLSALHRVVTDKLSTDPALSRLEQQAYAAAHRSDGDAQAQVSERTKERVKLALDEAAEGDEEFARALASSVALVRDTERQGVRSTDRHVAPAAVTVAGRDAIIVIRDQYTAGGDVTVIRR